MSLCVESSTRMFGMFEGVVETHRFYPVDTVEHLIYLQWRRESLKRKWRFGGSLNKIYLYVAQEWNFHWINKASGEK